MPVHDWTKVDPCIFHDFHLSWVTHLSERLNVRLRAHGLYSLIDQQAVLATPSLLLSDPAIESSVESSEKKNTARLNVMPPLRQRIRCGPNAIYRMLRRTLAIRSVTRHRLVALVEILSPGNKDRSRSVSAFVDKAHWALRHRCHLLIVDLFPPGPHDPRGIQAEIWADLDPDGEVSAGPDKPLTLGAYEAEKIPEAEIEFIAVGDPLPEMPLYLYDGQIDAPLEATYQTAFRGVPAYWRDVLQAKR